MGVLVSLLLRNIDLIPLLFVAYKKQVLQHTGYRQHRDESDSEAINTVPGANASVKARE
jgi:hypothetical protein